MKKYLVTGGTGFIGRSLVKALVKRGDQVKSFDDDSRGCKKWLADVADKVEFVTADIRDLDAVTEAASDVDCVCHLAYINGTDAFYKKPEVILDVAVKGMSNVISACIANNVKELCVASSSEVYQTPPTLPTSEDVPLSIPNPHNPRYSYAGGKIIGELMTLNFGKKFFEKVTIFRPHNIYGPHMGHAHVVPQLIEKIDSALDDGMLDGPGTGWPIGYWPPAVNVTIQGTGKETRSFCYIDDAIDGILKVMDLGKHLEIYNIGAEDEITIEELVKKLGLCFGRDVIITPGTLQKGSTLRRCPNITKLRALGYSPKITLDEGLRKCVYVYQATYRPNIGNDADSNSERLAQVSAAD